MLHTININIEKKIIKFFRFKILFFNKFYIIQIIMFQFNFYSSSFFKSKSTNLREALIN